MKVLKPLLVSTLTFYALSYLPAFAEEANNACDNNATKKAQAVKSALSVKCNTFGKNAFLFKTLLCGN